MGNGLSQVCSSSCPMASWISPLCSREYPCGLHGNMLRLRGITLEYLGHSMEIFWTQMLPGYDRKWLEWNYLGQQPISYFGGPLVLFYPYSFSFLRRMRVNVCMIYLWHPIGCIIVLIFCHFVDRLLFLSWWALCMNLIRHCRT